MEQPKVLVGCPTSHHKDYCLDRYVKSVNTLSYPNYDVLIVDNSETDEYYNKIKEKGLPVLRLEKYYEHARTRLTKSRNIIREKLLEGDYEYFLSLEQDVIPPRDIIETLLKSKKKVICGVYYNNSKDHPPGIKPLLWRLATKEELDKIITSDNPVYATIQKQIKDGEIKTPEKIVSRCTCEEVEEPRIFEIFETGVGCMLIHRSILEKIEFRSPLNATSFDDLWFCEDVRNSDCKLFVDTSVKCKHLVDGMEWGKIKY